VSSGVAWFFRAIELDGGQWACRFGRREFDVHAELEQSLAHLRLLAAEYDPVQFVVHRLDGSVEHTGGG
jgi:hypothetical protein